MAFLNYWLNVTKGSLTTDVEDSVESGLPKTAENVFHSYAPRVYNLARRIVDNDSDAEDVTQDVLLQVVRKIDTFRGDSNLTTWLHRVTVNAALLYGRRQKRQHQRQVKVPLEVLLDGEKYTCMATSAAPPDEKLLLDEMSERIEAAIAQLPKMYRDVYTLATFEGLSNEEISVQLGLTLAAIKSRLHRGRLLMRKALESYDFGD